MPKFLERNSRKQNKAKAGNVSALERMRRRIFWQAGLAVSTVVLTVVIVFAMTAAWKSNVVQTSGLQFQAESWGFDGNITVSETAVLAGPGDEGAVLLTVENANEDIASVSMNVSKTEMSGSYAGEMKKRLYLYVDAQTTRNGEIMDRVYINSEEGYTYTLLGGQTLTLMETLHNAPQLKWQWVYDVLGYYVLGTASSDGNVAVSEYLRPIEYAYDEASVVFETENNIHGELLSIAGQSVDDFMVELSKNDGYEGQIDPDTRLASGYYPVSVNSQGYGVYAYLCNYGEITYAMEIDTQLGQAATAGTQEIYVMKLTISAENDLTNVVEVGTVSGLQSAIAAGSADVIQLTDDVTLSDSNLVIPADQQVTLDLGGYTLKNNSDTNTVVVSEGASLTMFNGSISGNGSGQAVRSEGADILLSDVTIENTKYGVAVMDNQTTTGLDSNVHLLGCNISSGTTALFVSGNGTASSSMTQVVVENCTLYSEDNSAISGNGSDGRWGTYIQVLNSTVTGNPDKYTAGIYHPQQESMLLVYNSTVSGYTGIAIKGGSVSIDGGSKVAGEGAESVPTAFANSGFHDTGDGIYIETNYGYEIMLEIGGKSTVTSAYADSLRVYKEDATNVAVKIYSGVFDEAQPDAYIDKDSVQNGATVTENG